MTYKERARKVVETVDLTYQSENKLDADIVQAIRGRK